MHAFSYAWDFGHMTKMAELLLIEFLHCGNRDFGSFFFPWPLPWPDNLYIWTWSVFPGDIPDVWKRTSHIKAFKSYHITACKCVHLVSPDHFQLHDKDGVHTIRSTVAENTMLHAKAVCRRDPELLPVKVLHWRNVDFRLCLLLWFWPTCILSKYSGCVNMNFLRQRLLFDRQTDTTKIIYWVVNNGIELMV